MSIESLLKEIRKTTESTSFAASKENSKQTYISTGDYGLNRIITGDINKGIPTGKVVLLGGESQSGKSLVAGIIAANALKMGFEHIFYFDSEGGEIDFGNCGCDTSKIETVLVDSIEDATVKILKTYDSIKEYKKDNPDAMFLCILDSLGAMVSRKFIADAVEKEKQVSDMGLKAKLCNSLIKGLLIPAIVTNTSMIIINHVYDDPAAMHPSKIKKQSGGKGVQFAAHITIQCTKKLEKDDGGSYKAAVLKFFTIKNRMVKPYNETEMYLDFTKGPLKYYGLIEAAINYGFINKAKQGYYIVPSYSDKQQRLKDIVLKDEIWATFLDNFNKKSIEDLAYGKLDDSAATELDDEIENTEESNSAEEEEKA